MTRSAPRTASTRRPSCGWSSAGDGPLDEREQKILSLRFYGNLTQSDIAAQIGISQMHVSRLITRALAKLRTEITAD